MNLNYFIKNFFLNIKFIIIQFVIYYNKKHSIGPTFKEGNRIYLLQKNIIIK